MPYSMETLPDEHVEAAEAIEEQIAAATATADAVMALRMLDEAYDVAEQIDCPPYLVHSRAMQLRVYFMNDDYRAMIGTYAQIMTLVEQYSDYLESEYLVVLAPLVLAAVSGLISLPDAPREQIEGFLDHLERDHRRQGLSLTTAMLLRAFWSAHIGDEQATRHWRDEWQIAGPNGGRYGRTAVAMDAFLIGRFNLDEAIAGLAANRHAEPRDDDDTVALAVMEASLRSAAGDVATALGVVREVVDEYGLEFTVESSDGDEVLRALEGDPQLAARAAELVVANVNLDDPNEYETVAALARHLLLADPESARGRELGAQAERQAAAFDRRNGTPFQTTLLQERWFREL